MTLGRVRQGTSSDDRHRLGEALGRIAVPPAAFRIETVTLMRSELGRAGARYTPLEIIHLRETRVR